MFIMTLVRKERGSMSVPDFGNAQKNNKYLLLALGVIITAAWAGYLILTLAVSGSSNYASLDNVQPWYILLTSSVSGCLLWILINKTNNKASRSIALLSFVVGCLVLFLNIEFGNRGQLFYIGFIFFKDAGMAGFFSYLLSSTLVILISELSKTYRLGPPVLLLCASLVYMATTLTRPETYLNNIEFGFVVIVSSSAILALTTDIIMFLKWEFSKTGEV